MNYVQLINQLTEIEYKISQDNLMLKYERNFNRVRNLLEEEGYLFRYPIGEKYRESNTDCEAGIIGEESENMVVVQVIKPVIYKKDADKITLVQKGIVIVEKEK
ncbi:MAG TPA: hypothetical protein DEQ30_06590 [Porphyromonadaceae bacterium]|nr:hypothetical protein [Porphyromonadaceae bacterium]